FHGEKRKALGLTHGEDRNDVRMLQALLTAGPGTESFQVPGAGAVFRRNQLQSDQAVRWRVASFVDPTQGTVTELLKQLIVPQCAFHAGRVRHARRLSVQEGMNLELAFQGVAPLREPLIILA